MTIHFIFEEMRMESAMAKVTTILFLVTTFCLAGSAPAIDPNERLAVVRGYVYCESCLGTGISGATLMEAASVKIECKNATKKTKLFVIVNDGYFFLLTSNITDYAYTDCKSYLDKADPRSSCNNPTDLNGGITGGQLRPTNWSSDHNISFPLYESGPFTFRPICSPLV